MSAAVRMLLGRLGLSATLQAVTGTIIAVNSAASLATSGTLAWGLGWLWGWLSEQFNHLAAGTDLHSCP